MRNRRAKARVLRRARGRCVYCGVPLDGRSATIDHVVPRAAGGRRAGRVNRVPACPRCNALKADRNLVDFYRLLATALAQEES